MRHILQGVIHPDAPDYGEAVQNFADRAGISTRTVYRVLSGQAGNTTVPPSLRLGVADRLVTAAGRHLVETRVLVPQGVVDYLEAP